jgi:hypothetical protein
LENSQIFASQGAPRVSTTLVANSKFASGVNDTGSKFATGINGTGGK